MWHSIRYGVSHCLHAVLAPLEEVRRERSVHPSVRVLGYLSGAILLVAICLGLYVRWEVSREADMLIIFVSALVLLGLAVILYCYFRMVKASINVIHLWLGFLLGLLCFVSGPALDDNVKERTANYLYLISVVLRTLCALLERICGRTKYHPAFLTTGECLQLVGFASTSFVIRGSPSLTLLVTALAVLIVVLRVKAFLALPGLVCFAFAAEVAFRGYPINPFPLACVFSQLLCDPLLDLYYSGLSVTERWQPFLERRNMRQLSILLLVVVEVTYLVVAGRGLSHASKLYLRIPAFVACGLYWAVVHLVFLMNLYGFHIKVSDCQRVCLAQGPGATSLDKVMASKGVRHFSLISEALVILTLGSTVILAAPVWQSTSMFASTSLLVLLLESLFHGLFYELGKSLGGTCIGYAMVVPTNYCSPDGQPLLLPPDQVQLLNQRSTGTLSSMHLFFTRHLIESYGCDYSTSGVSLEALRAKLGSFLELRTADGPRHDTYVVFYSGHTHHSGTWALAGGGTLGLDEIVEWWQAKNAGARSRLILVLDVDDAHPWAEAVTRVGGGLYVAVQGATLSPRSRLGDFTARWVEFNCNPGADVRWSEPGRTMSAVYGVSRHWGDYTLHLPTEGDVADHWRTFLPRVAHPVVQLAAHLAVASNGGTQLCDVCHRFLRRLKLRWFPPAVLDTGQGFKLVRS